MDSNRVADDFRAKINERIVSACLGGGLTQQRADEIGFHMTDWLENFVSLGQLFNSGDSLSNEEVEKILIDFLVHVPNHLVAAKKLLLDLSTEDVFGVGIFE